MASLVKPRTIGVFLPRWSTSFALNVMTPKFFIERHMFTNLTFAMISAAAGEKTRSFARNSIDDRLTEWNTGGADKLLPGAKYVLFHALDLQERSRHQRLHLVPARKGDEENVLCTDR